MAQPTEPDLVGKQCIVAGWTAYASAAYVAERGKPADLEALRQHTLVLYKETMHAIEMFSLLEPYRGADAVRVDNIELAIQLVQAGTGIAVLPMMIEPGASGLIRLFAQPLITNHGWVVYHEAARETARVRAAVDLLVEFFVEQAELFSGVPCCSA